MDRTAIRNLRTTLAGIRAGVKTYRFLATPDGSAGPILIVRRGRVPQSEKLALIRQGCRRFVEGKVTRLDDGTVAFSGSGLDSKKVKAITEPLVSDLPILTDAVAQKG